MKQGTCLHYMEISPLLFIIGIVSFTFSVKFAFSSLYNYFLNNELNKYTLGVNNVKY